MSAHLFLTISAALVLLLLIACTLFCIALRRIEDRDGGVWSHSEDVPPEKGNGK